MPPTLRRTEERTKLRHPKTAGWRFTVPVRSFRGASSRRNAVAGADGSYIGGGSIRCQPRNSKDLRQRSRCCFRLEQSREPQHKHILSGESPNCNAVEKPYSCDLLAIELIRGVIAWRARSCPLPIVRFRQPLPRVIRRDMGLPAPLPGSAGSAFRILTKCAGGLRFGSQASARHLAAEA